MWGRLRRVTRRKCVRRHDKGRSAECGLVLALLGCLVPVRSAHAEPARLEAAGQDGTDFIAEARLLSQLVACAGDAKLPEGWPAPLLESHCVRLRKQTAKYRARWIERTRPFFARVVPADLPKSVVYPFGGGDLLTALATFPNADEFTTISLEAAGDVRGVPTLDAKQLEASLDSTLEHLRCLFTVSHSKTTNLKVGSHASLPGEIAFALVAFSVFDYEPVSLRYFRLDAQGKLTYLKASELPTVGVPRVRDSGPNPFANVEITFRSRQDPKDGAKEGAQAPLRVYRHLAANLDDEHFAANLPLSLHLTSKGPVSVLIKAASYLLWFGNFSRIRSYLLEHAAWMISDSTGIQPSLARAAGFEQDCYGLFHGPMLAKYSHTKSEFLTLWEASPKRTLPFYFGYPDIDGHGHMMVTRRTGKTAATETSQLATDRVSGGAHWRLQTEKGPIHVWQPRGYDPTTAGTVIYVHGYYTNVDGAWVQQALGEQFATSKANALFIVPEAPSGSNEEVLWPVLPDLLKEVERQLPGIKAREPIVVAGHSGAWRTFGNWTEDRDGKQVDVFILLDALYGLEDKFQSWLARHAGSDEPCMTLVSKDTANRVAQFLEKVPTARRRAGLPETYRDLTPAERNAPVLEITSDLGHTEIVTSGQVLPVLLHRSPLKAVRPPGFVKHKKAEVGAE
jgi:hypothetical protein